MSKLTYRVAIPIILVGVFAIAAFISVSYNQLQPSFYIIFMLLVVFVFFFGLATGQNLSSPIKKILDRAIELSKGNSSSRVYLETKDELAELAKALNTIAEEMELSQQQGVDLEKSVGIKVKARTQELEETINALEQKVKNRTIELERLIAESSKLQAEMKNKSTETIQLRKELNEVRQRAGKYKKPVPKEVEET